MFYILFYGAVHNLLGPVCVFLSIAIFYWNYGSEKYI